MINIYCDESCHLEHDAFDTMLLGAISCDKNCVPLIAKQIRRIKTRYGVPSSFEVKWTKVSPAKNDLYLALIDYFFMKPELSFRCVIANGKKRLNHVAFKQTYDDWYYKMYYLLLSKMIDPTQQYSVYIDIKDTRGAEKIRQLKKIINNYLYSFSQTCLQKIQLVQSHEVELLQLCDLIMGAVGYYNRFLASDNNAPNLSDAKRKICEKVIACSNRPLNHKTPLYEEKFNLFVWEPR